MQRFYWFWRVGGLSPPAALRAAQQCLRDPDQPDDGPALPVLPDGLDPSHPIYWAPFIFVGA